jgi:hypothetical protein
VIGKRREGKDKGFMYFWLNLLQGVNYCKAITSERNKNAKGSQGCGLIMICDNKIYLNELQSSWLFSSSHTERADQQNVFNITGAVKY